MLYLKERSRKGNSWAAGQKEVLLGRKIINSLNRSNKDYVIVSYILKAYPNKGPTTGRYYLQLKGKRSPVPSKVRDVVFDRVIKYMEYRGVELFWINMECMEQDKPKEKEVATQSMDQVYSRSNFPVGLLSVYIKSEEHMNLLAELLNGQLIMGEEDAKLQPRLSLARARKAL